MTGPSTSKAKPLPLMVAAVINATEADIGKRVIFRHTWDTKGHYLDHGVITWVSMGLTFVFVDYDGTGAGVGTLARNLEWGDP